MKNSGRKIQPWYTHAYGGYTTSFAYWILVYFHGIFMVGFVATQQVDTWSTGWGLKACTEWLVDDGTAHILQFFFPCDKI